MQVSPSVLTCDYGHMADEFAFVERTGADMVHLDVMDGVFVPNLSFGPPVIARLRPLTRLPFDVHLMMEYPDRLLEAFAKAGADLINFHVESAAPVRETVDRIHALGCKAALTVKPKTPIEAVYPYLDALDMVLIMTVNPGFGGQKFIPYTLQKVRDLKKMIDARGLKTDIEVDGGVNLSNVEEIMSAGANIIVAGSAVFNGDVAENTQMFLDILNS